MPCRHSSWAANNGQGQCIPDSICFSVVTCTVMHCDLGLSVFNPAAAWGCTLRGNQDTDLLSHLQTLESNVLTITSHPLQRQGLFQHGRMPPEVCRNWNSVKYHMAHCHYKHACRACGGPATALPAVTVLLACSQTSTLSLSEDYMQGQDPEHHCQVTVTSDLGPMYAAVEASQCSALLKFPPRVVSKLLCF